MSINSGVRLIDEGTGDLIQDLGTVTPYLSVGDEVVLSEDGGAATTYKVEKLQYVVAVNNHSTQTSAAQYSIAGRVDIIVSLVP